MKILVCEDNKLTSRTLSVVLEKAGFDVEVADDGTQALEYLGKNTYSIILIDIHLPFHSGLEVIKYLRKDLNKKTPVLILTAFSDPQFRKQSNELGINGYILKPFNPDELLKAIRDTIKK